VGSLPEGRWARGLVVVPLIALQGSLIQSFYTLVTADKTDTLQNRPRPCPTRAGGDSLINSDALWTSSVVKHAGRKLPGTPGASRHGADLPGPATGACAAPGGPGSVGVWAGRGCATADCQLVRCSGSLSVRLQAGRGLVSWDARQLGSQPAPSDLACLVNTLAALGAAGTWSRGATMAARRVACPPSRRPAHACAPCLLLTPTNARQTATTNAPSRLPTPAAQFCFATFEEVKALDAPPPDPASLLAVPGLLARHGASRVTFVVGGAQQGVWGPRSGPDPNAGSQRPAGHRTLPLQQKKPTLVQLGTAGLSRHAGPQGGEPMLHPLIEELIAAAKRAGLFTSMVRPPHIRAGAALPACLLPGRAAAR
jgi:hypothetical protein